MDEETGLVGIGLTTTCVERYFSPSLIFCMSSSVAGILALSTGSGNALWGVIRWLWRSRCPWHWSGQHAHTATLVEVRSTRRGSRSEDPRRTRSHELAFSSSSIVVLFSPLVSEDPNPTVPLEWFFHAYSKLMWEERGSSQKEAGSWRLRMGMWPGALRFSRFGFPSAFSSPRVVHEVCFSFRRFVARSCVNITRLSSVSLAGPDSLILCVWHRGVLGHFCEKRFSCFWRYFLWSTERLQGADLSKAALMSLEAKFTKFSKVFTSLSELAILNQSVSFKPSRVQNVTLYRKKKQKYKWISLHLK